MSAEPIAKVVADLRNQRIVNVLRDGWKEVSKGAELFRIASTWAGKGVVVDATALYDDLVDRPRPVYVYEDHPCITPPWPNAIVSYVNQHGNVICMSMMAIDWFADANVPVKDAIGLDAKEAWRNTTQADMQRWEPANPVDWDRVRWTIDTFVWVGGHTNSNVAPDGAMPTAGPVHLWRFAVYDTGEPADLHWVQLTSLSTERWDMAHLVLLGTLNLCNAVNTELVHVPPTYRAERRRLDRLGVQVHTIHIRPTGRRTGPGRETGTIPLHTVRGHFSHYGDCCPGRHEPRGLAFGRLTGRFWVPQSARGRIERGEIVSDYKVGP